MYRDGTVLPSVGLAIAAPAKEQQKRGQPVSPSRFVNLKPQSYFLVYRDRLSYFQFLKHWRGTLRTTIIILCLMTLDLARTDACSRACSTTAKMISAFYRH
jgi:hypothetical protein